MEAVRAFDAEWKKKNPFDFLMKKAGCILFFICGTLCMSAPVERDNFLPVTSLVLLRCSMYLHMLPYMKVDEDGETVSIYEKLKWMPVSKRQIQAVRREYAAKFCLKAGAALLAAQQIGAFLSRDWGIFNVLVPIGEAGVLFFVGIFDIYRKRRQ